MAHSYVEVHDSEQQAFRRFTDLYGKSAILLVDTYDVIEGIKKAATVARQVYKEKGIKIRGIRIDSGDFTSLTKFARQYFKKTGVEFLKIFVSSALDEYRIEQLLNSGAEIDGFGVGTKFAVCYHAPAVDIVYKIIQYAGKGLYKTSPDKQTKPRRKTILRTKDNFYVKDEVISFTGCANDLLRPFQWVPAGSIEPQISNLEILYPESMDKIKERLANELANLPDSIKAITNPQNYLVEFKC